ncbi:MAG: hypothetical protein KY476_21715 [Planctomycetes bacterium]|nr:hypothetical protein [Planctomycetota bacterium]
MFPAPAAVHAADAAPPVERGQRVFSAGHSFHMCVPRILGEMAEAAGIEGHEQVGTQSLGGSRCIQHWDVPDERNKVKPALATGKIDVLTLSPIYLPDEGIERLARLAVEHNPQVRVTVQEFWLPFDVYDTGYQRKRPAPPDRNTHTAEELRAMHAEYFKSMDEHVAALNEQLGRKTVFVVPAGQAVIALREDIIAGKAPGLVTQDALFRDAIGHPTPPLQALVAYCHFAVIYRRSPVGLPMPSVLVKAGRDEWDERLNRRLQEIAWEAALEHPHSGVSKRDAAKSAAWVQKKLELHLAVHRLYAAVCAVLHVASAELLTTGSR